MTRRRGCFVGCLLAVLSLPPQDASAQTAPRPAAPAFRDVTTSLGVDFRHRHFGTGEKYMPENMGSGVAVFDADGDGRLDLYFVQGAPWTDAAKAATPREQRTNRLYLQRDGRFVVQSSSGLEDDGYGMGVAVGDVNGDGLDDVYVTNYGPNRLFRGVGDGRFADETAARGLLDPEDTATRWSTGAAFFDADADGDLDLYVANYLIFERSRNTFCGSAARGIRSYCHPDLYPPQPDRFYRNVGNGRFVDESAGVGIHGPSIDRESKGLGVFAGDLDSDGRSDIYVANDSTRNLLFLSTTKGFREDGLLAGVGYSGAGRPEAGMGIAAGDVDGDGLLDLFVTHLDQETNTLYRNLGAGLFQDATTTAGLASPSLPWVGFGTQLFDADLDGDLDLLVVNGHIIDNIEQFDAERRHRQPAQFFENDGGQFSERSEILGLQDRPLAARGAVAVDWDEDGDLDLVITQNDGPALLLENRLAGGRSVTVSIDEVTEGRGARLTLFQVPSEGAAQALSTSWIDATSSYLSQPPLRQVVALPGSGPFRLEVHWPQEPQRPQTGAAEAGARTTTIELAEDGRRSALVSVRRPTP